MVHFSIIKYGGHCFVAHTVSIFVCRVSKISVQTQNGADNLQNLLFLVLYASCYLHQLYNLYLRQEIFSLSSKSLVGRTVSCFCLTISGNTLYSIYCTSIALFVLSPKNNFLATFPCPGRSISTSNNSRERILPLYSLCSIEMRLRIYKSKEPVRVPVNFPLIENHKCSWS